MFDEKKQLPNVIESYRQQGTAMATQHDFADYMYDKYFELVRNWDYDSSVPQFIAYCRGLVKFADMRKTLDSEMESLRIEQDILTDGK